MRLEYWNNFQSLYLVSLYSALAGGLCQWKTWINNILGKIMVARKHELHTKAERGVNEAIAFLSGSGESYRLTDVEVPQVDIKLIRKQLELTQSEFAGEFGIPLTTLKNWEQGHRQPEGATLLFFRLIAQDPEGMRKRVGKVLAGT